jgi:uncharacterized membrane protein YfcA
MPSLIDRIGLRGPKMKYWFLYIGAFYVAWVTLAFGYGYWPEVVAHWRIALVMIFGSLVAGSTPMGGGTVAFPFLVLAFGHPPALGRNFGLVIQALGMTSAMIFILCRGTPVQLRLLTATSVASSAGLLLGTFVVHPLISSTVVKLLFSCLWMSFGILTLAKNAEFCALENKPRLSWATAWRLGIPIGIAGGVITSLIGVGVEMLLYTSLVLLFRSDLKMAVPTAVSTMAMASVLGTALHLAIGDIEREVLLNWLAAGPIVVLGAPTGAFLVSVIPRIRTLYFVSLLCVAQFVWTLYQVAPGRKETLFVMAVLAVAVLAFYLLYRIGRRRAEAPAAPVLAWQEP